MGFINFNMVAVGKEFSLAEIMFDPATYCLKCRFLSAR